MMGSGPGSEHESAFCVRQTRPKAGHSSASPVRQAICPASCRTEPLSDGDEGGRRPLDFRASARAFMARESSADPQRDLPPQASSLPVSGPLLLPFTALEGLVLALRLMIDASASCCGETAGKLVQRLALPGVGTRH
jgi:hypothetical protein